MVSIELRTQSVESNSVEWETIVLVLADGGHIEVEGDAASLDLSVPVISVTSGSRLYCEDDPEEWARSLPTVYHAPDFMAVVVDDTDPPATREREREYVSVPETSHRPSAQ